MGRAYLAPYGVGLGHASRLVLVAERLREKGIAIQFSSYGEAANYVRMHGFPCQVVPSVEFAWSMEGGFSIKDSLSNIPVWFLNFSRQLGRESANLASFNPELVISDSRLSPIIAAKLMNVPSIVILNQIKLLLSPRLRSFAAAQLVERLVGEFLGLMWDSADRILVPDLPPPYTIASHNLSGISASCSRLEYIGYTSTRPETKLESVNSIMKQLGFSKSRPIIFYHISGPRRTREPLIRLAIDTTEMQTDVQVVISGGFPNGSTQARAIRKNVWYFDWCPVRDEILAMSDVVVMRGGHAALTQSIQFGKPIVTIPIENHGEQLGNSAKIAELGAGIMLSPKGLTPSILSATVKRILQESTFNSKARKLMKVSEQHNGIDAVVEVVSTYLA